MAQAAGIFRTTSWSDRAFRCQRRNGCGPPFATRLRGTGETGGHARRRTHGRKYLAPVSLPYGAGFRAAIFLEPDNPDDWPLHFTENGFVPLATYYSALNTDLSQEDPRLQRTAERLAASGVRIRHLQMDRFEEELRKIYAVSEVSFRKNFLYTPLAEEEFVAQYRQIEKHVRPELIQIAEQEQRPVGFIFTLPDLLQAQRGHVIDTVIVKTVAVMPDRAHAGLGGYLVGHCQKVARELGYKRAIHALMHESNASRNISGHYATPMRRYTLFAKSLRP